MVSLAAEFGHISQSGVEPYVGEGVWDGGAVL